MLMQSSLRNIKLFYIFNFLVDFNLLAPVAAIYFGMVSGSYALGMSVFSVTMISSAVFEVPTGMLSDHIGRRWMVVCASAAALVGAVLMVVQQNYPFLLLASVFFGLARSFQSGNNDALLYDTLAEHQKLDRYPELLGKTSSMFQLALAISAVFGSLLANVSYALLLWVALIPALLQLTIAFFFIEPRTHFKKQVDNPYVHLKESVLLFIHNPRLRLLSIAVIIGDSVAEAGYQFSTTFLNMVWPLWALGVARFLSNFLAFVSFYFSGRVIKKFGEFRVLVAGTLISRFTSIGSMVFLTVFSPLLYAAGAIFYGVIEVAKNHLLQQEFTDHQRATMGSLQSLAGSIGFAIMAVVIGWLADKIGVIPALVFAQLILFINVGIYWRLFKKQGVAT